MVNLMTKIGIFCSFLVQKNRNTPLDYYYRYEVATLDKYEYKVRTDEMKELIREAKFAEAMEIADSIDWRRVKNTKMLCTVSDIYKINRKFEESKEMVAEVLSEMGESATVRGETFTLEKFADFTNKISKKLR